MRREFVLRAVSHNVQSLRQPESIELVISFMRERGVDIYAVQEKIGVCAVVGYRPLHGL